ncbi:MAG: hypothetical protein ABIF40_03950 [archaeon]
MDATKKHKKMIEFEIENCIDNIDFYKKEIDYMQEKIQGLHRLKQSIEINE